jgi:hypothetical protein
VQVVKEGSEGIGREQSPKTQQGGQGRQGTETRGRQKSHEETRGRQKSHDKKAHKGIVS